MKKINLVVPVFNEEESIPLFIEEVNKVLLSDKEFVTKFSIEILFVDDGSKDKTLKVIHDFAKKLDYVKYLSFSKNQGQQAAQLAGLLYSKSDYTVCLDVDLQDPIVCVKQMAEILNSDDSVDIVRSVRRNRSKDSMFKRSSAKIFYRTINKLEGKEIFIENSNTFAMFKNNVKEEIIKNPSSDFCLLSILNTIGYKSAIIEFDRPERNVGETKYTTKKMFNYAVDLISSSTTKPLTVSIKLCIAFIILGIVGFIVSLVFFIMYCLVSSGIYIDAYFGHTLIAGIVSSGIALVISSTLIIAGIVLIPVSVQSIYLSNVLINTRKRAIFHIKETNLQN